MKKSSISIFITLILSIMFAATAHAATDKPEKLTVILDWFPNPDHAPLIIARDQGFFKAQNLDVELIGPADPTDPPKWVAAGKADVGITYQPDFMQQVDRGLPLISVGNLIDRPLDCIVVLKTSGIHSIRDLKGKRIGSGSGSTNSIMLKTMLKHSDMSENDIELINVRYSLTQALLSRKVDAVTGMMRNFEIPQIEAKGENAVTFFPEDHGIPNYSVLIFITHTTNASDPRIPRFLAAIKQAISWLDEHPQQGWQIFAKQYPESNNPVNQAAWFATMPYFAEDPAAFDHEEWQKFAAFMLDNNLIHKQLPASRYYAAIG